MENGHGIDSRKMLQELGPQFGGNFVVNPDQGLPSAAEVVAAMSQEEKSRVLVMVREADFGKMFESPIAK